MMKESCGCGEPRSGNAYLEGRLHVNTAKSLGIRDSRVREKRVTGSALSECRVN